MLDPKLIRANPELLRKAILDKNEKADIDAYLALDERRRKILVEVEKLRHEKRIASEEIGKRSAASGGSAAIEGESDLELRKSSTKEIAKRIKALEAELSPVEAEMEKIAEWFPNIPHSSVPVGKDSSANVEVRRWGEPPRFDFQPLPHHDLSRLLGIIDLEAASRVSGYGFALFRGAGAKLVRALIQFMLDFHVQKHGYEEVFAPFLVKRECLFGTGQLPKLEEDMYHIEKEDLFLNPTAEVPLTNMFRETVFKKDDLPVRITGYCASFRKEAGSYGKETKGIVRLHQFDKVELLKIVEPESSYAELENLVGDAEDILRSLEIPYRVMCLSTGDLSFAAAKCYDIEAWAGAEGKWLEVSSCSNFEEFQARRIGLRYRTEKSGKLEFVHTLNGSGLAIPRTLVCLLENNQLRDGSVKIPSALRPYVGADEIMPQVR